MLDPGCRGAATGNYPYICAGRYEKRTGETKNEFTFGVSPVRAGELDGPRARETPARSSRLPGEGSYLSRSISDG